MDTNLFTSKSKIVVTCPNRSVTYVKNELLDLGYSPIAESILSVTVEGTLLDCMKLNLYLRTAHRVLFLIKEFKAADPTALYDQVVQIPWEEYIDVAGYFSVLSFADNPEINDSRFPNLKCKDAIADRMVQKKRNRPDSGPDRNKTVVYLHWKDDRASIYFDTSGETIAKHGYRKIPFKAPLIESLAAAIVLATRWDKSSHFINPMCGSGTLAIEAALIAQSKAPGLFRINFGFMHILGFDQVKDKWEEMRSMARNSSSQKQVDFKIIASDIDPEAIELAKKNATTAGVAHLIDFYTCDFWDTPIPEDGPGVVVLNPEYGVRMGDETELVPVYKEIGDFFKKSCAGYMGYVFTGNLPLAKQVGLKPKRRIEFYNASIDCRLMEYELYRGTKSLKEIPSAS
ncbi:MAG: class I SAM-dependent RNA methyltransferase [Cytophagales bacterium]|nr:class I SAM-dependent RNA methyltransferase [Cytophagales bacterium]